MNNFTTPVALLIGGCLIASSIAIQPVLHGPYTAAGHNNGIVIYSRLTGDIVSCINHIIPCDMQ